MARTAGMVGHVVVATGRLATRYMAAGQVDRGLAVASEGFEEGLALGLPVQAAWCGDAMLRALVWRGRLDEAEQRLEELGELSESGWSARRWSTAAGRVELLLARGDAAAATPLVHENVACGWRRIRARRDVLDEIRLAVMLDDHPGALETARSYLAQMEDTDSPLRAAAVARIGFQALCLARSTPGIETDELRGLSARQLASAQAGLTDEWRPTYPGVQLALAEAYAARYAGEPAVAQFRAGDVTGGAVRRLLRPRATPGPGRPSCSPTAAGTRAASCSSSAGAPPTTWVPATSSAARSASPPAPAFPYPSRQHAKDR